MLEVTLFANQRIHHHTFDLFRYQLDQGQIESFETTVPGILLVAAGTLEMLLLLLLLLLLDGGDGHNIILSSTSLIDNNELHFKVSTSIA
jgi:hypothetical protein